MATQTRSVNPFDFKALASGIVLGFGVALILNTLVFLIATQVLDISVQIAQPNQEVAEDLPYPALVMASLVPAIGAGLLFAFLRRFTARYLIVFLGIALVFLLFSFTAPLGLPVEDDNKLVLNLMHVTTGLGIVGALLWTQKGD